MISLEVKDEGFTRLLSITIDRLQNMRPAMQEIGQYMEKSVLRNFDAGGRPAWKKNIAGTQVMMKSGKTHQSVRVEDVTESSVTIVANGGGVYHDKDHFTANTPKAKRFFWSQYLDTKLPHWKYLALSNKAVFLKPQRRFMMFQEQDKTEITNIIQTYLTKGE